ncbi:MAG: energy-coupling factor transporter transmembrane protein EcfT [Clostridiales bacterium]|nr:energy-coupling factor transporter transmembrane protein EcfT [Clostridiales bacterium]
MKIDIALGQYCEGNSPLHRLDPRAKLIMSILFIVAIFMAKNVFAFLFLILFSVALAAVSKVSPRVVLRGLKPILFIAAFTAVINLFFVRGEQLIFEFGFVKIYLEGIINAVLIVVRIIILLAASSMLLTYTTTPLALTDGLEQLLSPLAKLKIPVHDFSMMMTIALRFIPTLVEETEKIMNAQKARGADFTSGNIMKRVKALVPIIIPLFVSAFRRANELAVAMECRCYTGGEGRTRMNKLHAGMRDLFGILIVIAAGVVIVLINRVNFGFSLVM